MQLAILCRGKRVSENVTHKFFIDDTPLFHGRHRVAERKFVALLFHEPPRSTRNGATRFRQLA